MSDPVFSADWHSHNIPALTEVLAKFKGQSNIRALEIGCFEGKGTLWMLENILTDKASRITCIDTFQGSAEHAHFGMSFETARLKFQTNIGDDPKVSLIVGKSHAVLNALWPTWPEPASATSASRQLDRKPSPK